jgi:hypothetical protein
MRILLAFGKGKRKRNLHGKNKTEYRFWYSDRVWKNVLGPSMEKRTQTEVEKTYSIIERSKLLFTKVEFCKQKKRSCRRDDDFLKSLTGELKKKERKGERE